MGDLDLLVDMGFDRERAQLAVKKTGNIQGAVDWLEKNQDKSLDDIKAEAAAEDEEVASSRPAITANASGAASSEEQAQSLKCNECGKAFRGVAQAEFHASKTGHTDFAESTEEIKPLTEEEKKAKLADLREKLAAKRAALTDQDKEDKKKNEEIRRKATKESQDIKEALQAKERIKEAEAKRREKKEEQNARQRVLDQIQKDKEERKRKAEIEKAQRDGTALPQQSQQETQQAPQQQTQAKKPAASYDQARLRIKTQTGNLMKTFSPETTLFEVAFAVKEEHGCEVTTFKTTFPTKTFDQSDFGMSLKEAGMVPSASIIAN